MPVTKSGNARCAEKLLEFIPWGTSTCSKKAALTPQEPSVIVRGDGCRVWDADGREFIDFRNALGPVTLGYRREEVDEAIKKQLDDGIIFGHPHPIEGEVAELICDIVPCAEKARFLKTGGEAVAACLKLARAFTRKKHVIQIGYNGWLNSLAGNASVLPGAVARNIPAGVPGELSSLHHAAAWNDRDGVERLFDALAGDVAALVVSASYTDMELGAEFYPFLRKITEENGAVLVFDEIVTGFRIALGGVQEHFNVTPDLAVFAKGVANGMPLSVYCGKAEIMNKLDTAIVSSTYGGETLSLAAAKATIGVYLRENVVDHLWKIGAMFWDGFRALLKQYELPFDIAGFPPISIITLDEGAGPELKSRLLRNIYAEGVSLYNGGYVTFAHKSADIEEALTRIERAVSKSDFTG